MPRVEIVGTSCDPWGYASRLLVDGQEYHQTGNAPGRAVYAKAEDWEKAVRSFGDELLYVFDYYKMVPMSEWKAAKAEPTHPERPER